MNVQMKLLILFLGQAPTRQIFILAYIMVSLGRSFSSSRKRWLPERLHVQIYGSCMGTFRANIFSHLHRQLSSFYDYARRISKSFGLDDKRLANPTSQKPAFRFGTIPNGATDFVLQNNFPHTQHYMKRWDKTIKSHFDTY